MSMFEQNPPLSLYVHYPWCVRKCPYCDFNSHQQKDDIPEQDYIQALLLDLQQELPQVWGRKVSSVFIGGGTPSLLSVAAVDNLLSGIRALLPVAVDAEVTLEANPGTAQMQRFVGYRQAGVNRLSLGVQSFNDEKLKSLGRIHSAAEAQRACEMALAAGFDNFNIDLMYGLPQQEPEQALADLRQAVALQPGHISHYQLTLEPNTVFYQSPPTLPSADYIWDMQVQCQAYLADFGYKQYEVSAYARDGRHCKHNMNYWQFGDYLGIGCGAHGKITIVPQSRVMRTIKHRHPKDYLASAHAVQQGQARFSSSSRDLADDDLSFEFMLNALRLKSGVANDLFQQRTGLPLDAIDNKIKDAREKGLLLADETVVCASEQGYRFLDDLVRLFL